MAVWTFMKEGADRAEARVALLSYFDTWVLTIRDFHSVEVQFWPALELGFLPGLLKFNFLFW